MTPDPVINSGSRSNTDPDPQLITRKESAIAGHGLFALAAIRSGTRLPDPDADLLNHSCDPNLGWTPDGALVALRDIGEDEELTVDYATFIDDPSFTLFCHCGTYRCRQVIEGSDWQIPQLQRRYAGHWRPDVQALIDNL